MSFGDAAVLSYLKQNPLFHKRVTVAFDGFIDEIKRVVLKGSQNKRDFYQTKRQFLDDLDGENCNKDLKLVTAHRKIGGSGAIAAYALAQLGLSVDAWLTVNDDEVFHPLANQVNLHSIGQPPLTWALEFETGKVMLADHAPLDSLNWAALESAGLIPALKDSVSQCETLILAGYAMLEHGHELYSRMLKEILLPLSVKPQILVDLADISQKSETDQKRLMDLLQEFGRSCDATVLLNRNESRALLGLDHSCGYLSAFHMACRLGERLAPCKVLIHTAEESAFFAKGHAEQVFHPKALRSVIKTGCGDHFCAGYCTGQLLKMSPTESMRLAGALSRYYIENGASPTLDELCRDLENRLSAQDGPYRMIAMDFDGTILNADHQIPPHTKKILHQAKEEGILLCACTGRSFFDTLRLLGPNHDFDFAITSNGGNIHDLKRNLSLQASTICPDAAEKVMETLEKYPLYYEAYTEGRPWAEASRLELLKRDPNQYQDYLAGGGNLVRKVENLRKKLEEPGSAPTKFYIMADSHFDISALRLELESIPGITCTSSDRQNIEVLPFGVDKSKALHQVAKAARISVEQILALGDGENDTEMLQNCGCGVAMENAEPELKQAVPYICPPCSQEGAADAITYFCLNQVEKTAVQQA